MRITIVLIFLFVLGACSGETKREQRRELLRVPKAKTQKPVRTTPFNWFDEKGNLLPSEQQIAGLKLPRGLKLKRETELRHFYETSIPANKLHWYFSARIKTAKIKRVSGSTTYVAAKLIDGSSDSTRFDVKITPNRTPKGKTRVEIRRLLPRKPTPPLPKLMKDINRKRRSID
jgi:hypothetical protein